MPPNSMPHAIPKRATPLTEMQIRKAKPAEKPYRLADGKGLYLGVMPNGSRYWRMKYRFDRKEKRAAFSVYPEVTLAEARQACLNARGRTDAAYGTFPAKVDASPCATITFARGFGNSCENRRRHPWWPSNGRSS